MEKERNEIVSELSDDIIFDYNMREDELQVFYPASVAGEKHKKIIKNARVSEGWKELGVSPEDEAEIYEKIMDISNDKISNKTIKAEYQIADGNGKNIWRRVLMRGVFDSEGNLAKVVGKVVDISSEKELMLRSSTDSLTSAYNRSYLELAVKKAIRNKGVDLYYACLLIDIDFFKEINDKFGHLQGDCVLIEVVKMCRTLFRSTDIVARLGGDEFMIFMRDIYDQKIVLEKARKMLDIAENYCIREGLPDRLSLSMGIVIDDDVATNFKQLYHQADIALYQAKQNGRGRYVVFEEGMMHPSD
ncbi:MAG: GGDEF domain-containing protein [[Clostridium] scindens]